MKVKAVLVSGWGYAADALEALAAALRPDLEPETPACAALAPGGTPPRAALGQALAHRIEQIGSAVALVGWSMGGMIAVEACLAAPHAVAALVLVASTARFTEAGGYAGGVPRRRLRAMMLGMRRSPKDTLRRFYEDVVAPATASPPPAAPFAATAAAAEWLRTLREGLDYLDQTDLRAALPGIRVPTLVLHGSEDRVVPWQAGECLGRNIPGAEFVLRPGAGHALPVQEPEWVAAMVLDFLRRRGVCPC